MAGFHEASIKGKLDTRLAKNANHSIWKSERAR